MRKPASAKECAALINALRAAYMEIYPATKIDEKLALLKPNARVAVTCSPSRGIERTLQLTESLVNKGFRVVPHIAAKNVSTTKQLGEIVKRLTDLNVESVFIPGGDRSQPVGDFRNAHELLQALSEIDHGIKEIGVAAHPERHPDIDPGTLFTELRKKQQFASYMVTQMCFDAAALGIWLKNMRSNGISLPVWLGLPGVINRSRLLKTSFKIGVGDSLRFVRKKSKVAAELMKSSVYRPDDLLLDLVKYQVDPDMHIVGYHLFSFNQVDGTENWRNEFTASIEKLAYADS